MNFEIRFQFEQFVEMLESGEFSTSGCNNFMYAWDFEDDYGIHDIGEAMCQFEKLVKKYLHENHSGEYGMHIDSCVHIYTIDFLRRSKLDGRYVVY